MNIEKTGNYFWFECSTEQCDIGVIVENLPELFLGKNLIIVSFDSGPFVPTEEEINRGWKFINDIAYFDAINQYELNGPIYDQYDQWLVMNEVTRIEKMDVYVNYSPFSILSENCKNEYQVSLRIKFWEEIHCINPEQFFLSGSKFIYGTTNEEYINQLLKFISKSN